MANQINNTDNHEIDLGHVARNLRRALSRVNNSFFDGILFIKRNFFILLAVIAAGVGLGYYLDKSEDIYKTKMFVVLNFESADYVYSEIENFNTKLRENNPAFFTGLGFKNHGNIIKAEIEPVIDIYEFLDTTPEGLKYEDQPESVNFQMFKLLSESGKLTEVLKDEVTAKNYKRHLITITTRSSVPESELIAPILKYFNSSSYFDTIKKESIKNLDLKIAANDTVIKQIDNILNDFSNSGKRLSNPNLVYFNDNTQLDQIIKIKDQLVREQNINRINKINYTDVVRESGVMSNMKNYNATTERMKFILPVIFVLIYFFVFAFRSYYRSQINKRKLTANG